MDYEILRPPEQLCGIFWRCLSTVLPLKHWVRSDLLFRSASLLHCGQEQDRSLQRFYQHQELWYFSRSLLQDISGKVNISPQFANLKENGVLVPISGVLLWAIPNYMISNEMGVAIFRGNHGYKLCGLTDPEGIVIRLLMYLVSFILIYTFLALLPDIKLPITYVGRHTMGIYFFHYPIMIIMNGLYLLQIPEMNNVWVLLGVSLVFVLVLGICRWIFFIQVC